MVYGRYKEIRNAAWQTLIDFNVRSLPVSISDITDQLGIGLIDNIKINLLKQDERGATIYVKKQWYIILDESEQVETQRFTAAHELAHILLGHILTAKAKYRTFTKRTEEEQAADMFAARLLAPACVLHEISACSADRIWIVCNISTAAAKIRAERMRELERRNKYYLHPLEQQVKTQFEDFIKANTQ